MKKSPKVENMIRAKENKKVQIDQLYAKLGRLQIQQEIHANAANQIHSERQKIYQQIQQLEKE